MNNYKDKMKKLILIIIAVFLIGNSCNEAPIPSSTDCTEKIDSLNKHWKDIVLALSTPQPVQDTIWTYKDSIIWIDSTRWITNWVDSIRWIDSVRYLTNDPVGPLFQEISIDSVKVDSYYLTMSASNLLDNVLYHSKLDIGTRWGQEGYPHQAIFYFKDYLVTQIAINVFGWDEGLTHQIKVYNYADSIYTGTTSPELWSKHNVYYRGNHLYLDILGGQNDWTDVAEVKLYGYKIKEQ